ncbi:hypothetical protein HPC49_24180 [Pyxidicoccus fallax]|uniref:Uncharacterized protein n=1 Tax=Pyxidicoccus fallax TaxID=394095 RepID=A0A848LBP6_9BACT|nr:hypothetical protein [Pyxidicoccus fallax]NMO15906.1 hypothetical protein [Pyxidicoccus fallax]NPC81314.1 hypothetical protein [Pyxidicoccus fallax]
MDVNDLKLKLFKEQVGFDRIPVVEDADVGVVADWGGLAELLPSRENGWEPGPDALVPLPKSGMVLRQWYFRRGAGVLIVEVFVFSDGPAGARDQLVAKAVTLNSVPISPYVRGPESLGHFSIKTPRDSRQSMVWVFHNVCVEIREDNTGIPVEPLARAIQGYMERHVKQKVSQHLPRLDKVTVSKSPIQVGQEVQVEVHLKDAAAPGRWRVNFTPPEGVLAYGRSMGPTFRGFQALRPGMAQVDVDVTDTLTLLRTRTHAQVEIQPAR